jgi:uncharacterized membrane protein
MQSPFLPPRRLSDYTNVPVEIFVAALTVLPFLVMAYFYPVLPERVPLFMNLNGDVAVWGAKSLLSVFRVPLMAAVTQVFCLLMKQSVLQSTAALPVENADEFARLHEQSTVLSLSLWDGFRCIAAFKMSAASFDTVFLSIERFNYLSKPAFIITFAAALLSVPVGLVYGYRWLAVRRKIKERFGDAKIQKPIDEGRVYGGVVYFNPSDSALFVGKYMFNFANKWTYAFIACIVAYLLLVFLPV